MKVKQIGLLIIFFLGNKTTMATEYIYRDLMANTLPSTHCLTESQAKQTAQKPYTIDKYSKRFCQLQGYGWHLDQIKDTGKLICDDCSINSSATAQTQKCHLDDVIVTCKRIKPGSVGMLPGQN
jgi:hypothetical protein